MPVVLLTEPYVSPGSIMHHSWHFKKLLFLHQGVGHSLNMPCKQHKAATAKQTNMRIGPPGTRHVSAAWPVIYGADRNRLASNSAGLQPVM